MSSKNKPSPLRINKKSNRIRKSPCPLQDVQTRQPVIIHSYSPKIIHTHPDKFMWLVQKLTGSSATRIRCNMTDPANSSNSADGYSNHLSDHSQSCVSVGNSLNNDNFLRSMTLRSFLSPKSNYLSKCHVSRNGYGMEGAIQAAYDVSQSNLPVPITPRLQYAPLIMTSQRVVEHLPCLSPADVRAQLHKV
ncbi:hypothetical protein O6H91_19G081600 [Diphasiastrum complanatum]|uniref:Uncharacterized protein n=1 Tax=Diphasiastrum complanatum TaxID=34168 RepID=A0ACC2AX18_DIPCM|nr:hypothetical protein O6H91_19G081600 [Diphasiastrum complanatum]